MSPVAYPHSELTEKIIGAAIEVHKHLGPGLLESAYQVCLCRELASSGIAFAVEVPLPVSYKGHLLEAGYRLDIVVEELVILELKSIEQLNSVHEAQLLTYLRLSGKRVGLLINFNVALLKDGIIRRVV
ncbi:GxxExxY protein [Pirellulimonas nuda]|uniref:GxxExxY protein n=1 Tax=Pirellulimonas nuda TaxID=2528009 RepID=UPI0011AA6635|nr:GxxExxY protein [Pirellulimonas nuda]